MANDLYYLAIRHYVKIIIFHLLKLYPDLNKQLQKLYIEVINHNKVQTTLNKSDWQQTIKS